MTKRDIYLVTLIGLLVGLLIQPILSNTKSLVLISSYAKLPQDLMRVLICVFFLILAPLALWIAGQAAKLLPVIYQVSKFAAVGTLNTLVDLGVFNLISIYSGIQLSAASKVIYAGFKGVSFLCATTNSYFWNKLWTFGDNSKNDPTTVFKFYLITIINFGLNVGVTTMVRSMNASVIGPEFWAGVVAPLCGVFAGMASNFLGYKFLVFRKKTKEDSMPVPQS